MSRIDWIFFYRPPPIRPLLGRRCILSNVNAICTSVCIHIQGDSKRIERYNVSKNRYVLKTKRFVFFEHPVRYAWVYRVILIFRNRVSSLNKRTERARRERERERMTDKRISTILNSIQYNMVNAFSEPAAERERTAGIADVTDARHGTI